MEQDILFLFGKRIRELRQNNGWSQELLAEKTDLHRTYIGMVERGERNLSLINIVKFSKCFNITVEELFRNICQ